MSGQRPCRRWVACRRAPSCSAVAALAGGHPVQRTALPCCPCSQAEDAQGAGPHPAQGRHHHAYAGSQVGSHQPGSRPLAPQSSLHSNGGRASSRRRQQQLSVVPGMGAAQCTGCVALMAAVLPWEGCSPAPLVCPACSTMLLCARIVQHSACGSPCQTGTFVQGPLSLSRAASPHCLFLLLTLVISSALHRCFCLLPLPLTPPQSSHPSEMGHASFCPLLHTLLSSAPPPPLDC